MKDIGLRGGKIRRVFLCLTAVLVMLFAGKAFAANDTWTIDKVSPQSVEWPSSVHGPVHAGEYVRLNGVYYFVDYSDVSAEGPDHYYAGLIECDQATGAASWDPTTGPVFPDLLAAGVTAGMTIESIPSWPGAPASWNITNLDSSSIDWPISVHTILGRGSYVRINNKMYRVDISHPCSGLSDTDCVAPQYNIAMLYQCDQMSGEVCSEQINCPGL